MDYYIINTTIILNISVRISSNSNIAIVINIIFDISINIWKVTI